MRRRFHIWALYVSLFLIGCEKASNWEIEPQFDNVYIVEALITNEAKRHAVKVSYMNSQLNEGFNGVAGANVQITDGDSVFDLGMSEETGVYETDAFFQAVLGKEYVLTINIEGETLNASTSLLPVKPMDTIEYVLVNSNDSLYRIGTIASQYSNDVAMYELFLDWSFLSGYDTLPVMDASAKYYFYSFNTVDEHQIFSGTKETITFPKGTKIIEKKYSLTPEQASFYRSFLSETEWKGGGFDANPANLPSNFTEGAIGFFSASSVIVDTIYVR